MILVAGEALIDLFVDTRDPNGQRHGLPALAVAGGSPFNLAIGIRRLGAASGFLGGLSGDGFGRLLAARLAAEGVDIADAKASVRPTPIAVVATGADGHPDYTFHAAGCAACYLTTSEAPADLSAISALALGSLSLVLEPVGTTLVDLARRTSGHCVVSLDPNLRPALIRDMAAWRARFDGLVRHATIVKASTEDLAAAYGSDAETGVIAARWLEAGARLVVVTDGPRGAAAYHASGLVEVPGRMVEVIDTVGAGDTIHAAILARLERLERLTRDAVADLDADALHGLLTEATIAAALTCTRRGADPPTLAELQAVTRAATAPVERPSKSRQLGED